jgi:carbon-monoxide dehydrogenase medium subunit
VKPAAFQYFRPATLDEGLSLLAEHGDEAKVLAGGQSLVPMMNFRLARPEIIVDIGAIPGLNGVALDHERLTLGAKVRHFELEHPTFDGPLAQLFATAAAHVGHLPIRKRGTIGGSIAHADPAAEWCLLATALDAEIVVQSTRGSRNIPISDFFEMYFTTAIADDELLTEIRVPALRDDWKTGFSEFSRRAGDFAVVAVASAVRINDGKVTEARIAAAGVAGTPVRLVNAEAALIGTTPDADVLVDVAEIARSEVDSSGDLHGSSEYRQDLVRALTRRALSQSI